MTGLQDLQIPELTNISSASNSCRTFFFFSSCLHSCYFTFSTPRPILSCASRSCTCFSFLGCVPFLVVLPFRLLELLFLFFSVFIISFYFYVPFSCSCSSSCLLVLLFPLQELIFLVLLIRVVLVL